MGILSTVTGFNPYALIAGGVVVASIVGGFVYEDHMIHRYHNLFNAEHDNFILEHQNVKTLLAVQKDQTTKTEGNVAQVIVVPGPTKTIVKEIQSAPEPANCKTPVLSEEATNAF